MLPEQIRKFADFFSRLPSIGPRQAIRLGFHLVNAGKNEINNIEEAVRNLKRLKPCSHCFFVHETSGNLCPICSNEIRNKKVIAIVEKETDVVSIEKTGKFNGRYLVLGGLAKDGLLAPHQKLRLENLTDSIQREFGQAEEIILAVNPTTFGDFTASLLT